MTIVDAVLGNNELDLFRIRYHELKDVVDFFVIIEAPYTHSGKPKPLHFSEWYTSAKDPEIDRKRVEIITWDNYFNGATDNVTAWRREHLTREMLGNYLRTTYAPETLCMLSDMDEIPRAASIIPNTFEHDTLYIFEQDLSYLYFNAFDSIWYGTRLFSLSYLNKLTDINPMRTGVRYNSQGTVIPNAGWHFSSCFGVEGVKEKLQSFAHTELQHLAHDGTVENAYIKLVNPFTDEPLTVRPITTLPQHVQDNIETYKSYVILD